MASFVLPSASAAIYSYLAVHQERAVPSVIAVPTLNPARWRFGVIDHPVALASEIAIQHVRNAVHKFLEGAIGFSFALFVLENDASPHECDRC